MARSKYVYKQNEIETVEELASKGLTDTEIVKRTGAKYGFVQRITTSYWKNKMKQKNTK